MEHRIPDWQMLPSITLPTPILSIATGPDTCWVSGVGGIARAALPLDAQSNMWQPCIAGLPLTSITALMFAGGWLFAGGPEGIARSSDEGSTWQRAQIEGDTCAVSAIVASPAFSKDTTALAASLDGGVVRTTNAGRTWSLATFGLHDFEVTALLWTSGTTVLAATADGVYRSPNAGRAWRVASGSEGVAIATLATLADGSIVAATESGVLLCSSNDGAAWAPYGTLPADVMPTALLATADVLVVGTAEHGLFRSLDGGHTWPTMQPGAVLALAASEHVLLAGLHSGLMTSADRGQTWMPLPSPPIHDLRQLIVAQGQPLVWGRHSGLLRLHEQREWTVVSGVQPPIYALALQGAAMFVSSQAGCDRSLDGGQTWTRVCTSAGEFLAHLTFRADGRGWAGRVASTHLLRTLDNGAHWDVLPAPFGDVPLVALQTLPDLLMAATYDPRRQIAQLWRSLDDGDTWLGGAQAQTPWPIVATWAQPPLLSLGGTIMHQRSDGAWQQSVIGAGSGCIRTFSGDGQLLFALTTTGIYRLTDAGATWLHETDTVPIEQTLDITVADGTLYILLVSGQVWQRAAVFL